MEKQRYVFHNGNSLQIDFFQICKSLNRRINQWNGKGLHHCAFSDKCRLHNTCRHNEFECLAFLDNIEMVLQRNLFMQNLSEPLATSDLGFIDVAVEAFTQIVEDQLVGGKCLQDFLSSKWCRVHDAAHSEFICRSCGDIIFKVGEYLEWKGELSKECTAEGLTSPQSKDGIVTDADVTLEGTECHEGEYEASEIIEEYLSEESPMEIKEDVLVEASQVPKNIVEAEQEVPLQALPFQDEDVIQTRYKDFVARIIRDWSSLGFGVYLEELLLPAWCRVHEEEHSEFTCFQCQTVIKEVREQVQLLLHANDTQTDASDKSLTEECQPVADERLEEHEEALSEVINVPDDCDQESELVPTEDEFRESSHLSNSIFPQLIDELYNKNSQILCAIDGVANVVHATVQKNMNDVENRNDVVSIGEHAPTSPGENVLEDQFVIPSDEHTTEEIFVQDNASAFSLLIPHGNTQTGEKFHVHSSESLRYEFHSASCNDPFNSSLPVSNASGILHHQWRPPDDTMINSSQVQDDEHNIQSAEMQN